MRLVVPDLPQDGPRTADDVRDPEGAPDLDQFAARHQDLPAEGEGVQDEDDGGGIVVDDRGCLGPGQVTQQSFNMAVPFAAFAACEVVFQVGGTRHRLRRRRRRLLRHRRSAEVGVQHRSGQVEHRTLRPGETGGQQIGRFGHDGVRLCPGFGFCRARSVAGAARQTIATRREAGAKRLGRCRPAKSDEQNGSLRRAQQRIDRWKRTLLSHSGLHL